MKKPQSVLAIIPARGGSKGVPRKNIRNLCGRPLISYAIEIGLNSPSVERVIVSTEDAEIAEIARVCGAEVPFLRPRSLAGDDVPEQPVFQHALQWLEDNEDYVPQFVLSLRCTTPLKAVEDVESVVKKLKASDCDSVRTMTQVQGVHHPYWMYKDSKGLAEPFVEGLDVKKWYQRQSLPPVFRLNGVVDGARRSIIMEKPHIWGDSMAMVEVPEERSGDIDTEFDFSFVEFLMNKKIANR